MTGVALSSLHRGACPGLSAPMLTGDGLLVRLLPSGTISRDAFRTLCTAAQEHGNGVIEITARGSIQIRGLTAASAARFAATIAESGIAAADAPPVLSSPLAGLAANEILDASALAEALRQALAKTSLPPRLAPKLSVVIDGGGALNLDHLSADVRLCAESTDGEPAVRISVAGNHASALMLGMVPLDRAIEVTLILLDAICRSGHVVRARDIVAADGGAEFRTTIADFLIPDRSPAARTARQSNTPIGDHPLRDGTFARGFGLAFGHAEAKALAGLIEAAAGAAPQACAPHRDARSWSSGSPRSRRRRLPPRRKRTALLFAPTIRAASSSRVPAHRSARPRTSPPALWRRAWRRSPRRGSGQNSTCTFRAASRVALIRKPPRSPSWARMPVAR